MRGDALVPILERLRGEVEGVDRIGPAGIPDALALAAHAGEPPSA